MKKIIAFLAVIGTMVLALYAGIHQWMWFGYIASGITVIGLLILLWKKLDDIFPPNNK